MKERGGRKWMRERRGRERVKAEEGVGQISEEVGSWGDITRVMRAERGEIEEVKFREEEEKEWEFFNGGRRNKRGMVGGGHLWRGGERMGGVRGERA